MDKICEDNKCYGCGACSGVCPMDCISFTPKMNDCGQIHPVINNKICINCGKCQKVCPVNNTLQVTTIKKCYGGYSTDKEYSKSSSGGIAWVLAKHIIGKGGVAYGAAIEYGENIEVKHIRVSRESELYLLQGSKYVQSYIDRTIYKQVLNDLKNDLNVVFFGTGCQIAALKSYLRSDYQKLITVDIICHGVPSIKILNDYLISTHRDPKNIEYISFRQKENFNMKIINSSNNEHLIPFKKSSYIQGFYKALFYRESCYNCPYAQPQRGGDFTLGDFWGLKTKLKSDPKGKKSVSVILINTNKGETVLSECTSMMDFEERDKSEAINGNKQLRFPSKKHFAHGLFKILYPLLGYNISSSILLVREKIFYNYALPFYYKYIEKNK